MPSLPTLPEPWGASIATDSSDFILLSAGRLVPAPWGAYIAHYSDVTKLYDYTGNNRHATISGRRPVLNTQMEDGAEFPIPSLTGSTKTRIIWPPGSIPENFTICSITRYAGSARQRVLAGTSATNWLHGHHLDKSGVAFYNDWITQYAGSAYFAYIKTNWLVMCGTNNNILANGGNEYRTPTNKISGNDTLTINGFGSEESDFGFQQVIIWNSELSLYDMRTVSNLLTTYLTDGDITRYPWYNSGNLIPNQSNYYKTTNSIQTSIHPTFDPTLGVSSSIIKIVTDNSLNGVSNPYKFNDSYIFSYILDASYSSDFTGIDENPTTVGYSVGGTDVSTWSIAPYVDINHFPTFSSDKIPSWCKAIRVIMIGKGGTGGQSYNKPDTDEGEQKDDKWTTVIAGQQYNETTDKHEGPGVFGPHLTEALRKEETPNGGELYIGQHQHKNTPGFEQHQNNTMIGFNKNVQSDTNRIVNEGLFKTYNVQTQKHYYLQYVWERHQNRDRTQFLIQQTGGGGGGGGAVYIASISTETYPQIQIDGASSIILKLNGNNAVICNPGGDGAGSSKVGVGGTVTTQGFTPTFSANGRPGTNGYGGNNGFNSVAGYATTLQTGKGGGSSTSGTGPYYRVYFLTN
jgi:hypothetical protein